MPTAATYSGVMAISSSYLDSMTEYFTNIFIKHEKFNEVSSIIFI